MSAIRKGESVFSLSDGTSLLFRLSMEGNLCTVMSHQKLYGTTVGIVEEEVVTYLLSLPPPNFSCNIKIMDVSFC